MSQPHELRPRPIADGSAPSPFRGLLDRRMPERQRETSRQGRVVVLESARGDPSAPAARRRLAGYPRRDPLIPGIAITDTTGGASGLGLRVRCPARPAMSTLQETCVLCGLTGCVRAIARCVRAPLRRVPSRAASFRFAWHLVQPPTTAKRSSYSMASSDLSDGSSKEQRRCLSWSSPQRDRSTASDSCSPSTRQRARRQCSTRRAWCARSLMMTA